MNRDFGSYRSNRFIFGKSVLGRVIDYHGYVTVEDGRSIVLRKVLGFAMGLHVEICSLRGNEHVFIHVDCVNFALDLKIMFERMDS